MSDSNSPGRCETLLVRAGHGDVVAFAELYDDTAPAVFGLVRSIVPDPAQAERTTLAVYREVWREAGGYDPGQGGASSLLLAMARRHALGQLPADAGAAEPAADPGSGHPRCARLLAAVPAGSREALVLTYFCGQTIAETAGLLGTSTARVAAQVRGALASLRQSTRAHTVATGDARH